MDARIVDARIIDAARLGQRQARADLLASLQDVWFRFCMKLLNDPDRAADATQETALRFLSQLANFRGESQLRTWSLGISLNVCREMKRNRVNESLADRDVSSPAAPIDVSASRHEEQAMLRQTLDALPDRQREAIVLRFFEELSIEETAAVMQCATGTVKATIHQALRALRRQMTPTI